MVCRYKNHTSRLVSVSPDYFLPKNLTTAFVYLKLHESCIIRGGFRGGVRGVGPPKIRKAYVIHR